MRLIDADAVLDKSCWLETYVPTRVAPLRTEIVYADELRDAPTIDAVPVVRCRKCRYNTTEKKCLNPNSIIKNPDDNDFCSYGERREGFDKMSNLEKAKKIIKEHYVRCGIFNSRNVVGDPMDTIYQDNGLQIDVCYHYEYFEVFGLTDSEFAELEKYYEELGW